MQIVDALNTTPLGAFAANCSLSAVGGTYFRYALISLVEISVTDVGFERFLCNSVEMQKLAVFETVLTVEADPRGVSHRQPRQGPAGLLLSTICT